jgi:hypothetical protein
MAYLVLPTSSSNRGKWGLYRQEKIAVNDLAAKRTSRAGAVTSAF